jgi:hypothetical protein
VRCGVEAGASGDLQRRGPCRQRPTSPTQRDRHYPDRTGPHRPGTCSVRNEAGPYIRRPLPLSPQQQRGTRGIASTWQWGPTLATGITTSTPASPCCATPITARHHQTAATTTTTTTTGRATAPQRRRVRLGGLRRPSCTIRPPCT